MKKIYFSTALLLLFKSASIAQALNFQITDVTYNSGLVTDNKVFEHVTSPVTTVKHYFDVKNISASNQTVSIKKSVLLMNSVSSSDEAQIYYCTGLTCYDALTMSSAMTMTPGEIISFTADLDEASVTGVSSVDYRFSNAGSAINVSLRYNRPETVSINENSSVFSNASAAYPNPSAAKTFIDINSQKQIDNVKLTVLNSLGAVVLSKQINIVSGKNTVSIESESFNSGIYFATISNGNSVITKKITIVK